MKTLDEDQSPRDAELLDTSAAARYLGVISVRTLEAWRHRQQAGPRYLKLGRRVAYRLGDLRNWIDQQIRG
jgi:predicted DNA-binding transcriptional regulator AlpA